MNCLVLVIIEVLYIVSQRDSLIESGLPIALMVFILFGVTLISNATSTFYLYRIELKLMKKNEESK